MSDAYSNPPGNPQYPPQSASALRALWARSSRGARWRNPTFAGDWPSDPFAAALDLPERRRAGPICLDPRKERAEAEVAGNCWTKAAARRSAQYRTVVKPCSHRSWRQGVASGGREGQRELSGSSSGPAGRSRAGPGSACRRRGRFIITNYHVVIARRMSASN